MLCKNMAHAKSYVILRLVGSLITLLAGCATSPNIIRTEPITEEGARTAERERLRSLVDKNMIVAERRHASDLQVINPLGRGYSKAGYLASVVSDESDYLSWVPEGIAVRMQGRLAAIRYRSQVDLAVRGRRLPSMLAWNTGVYEHRDGRWQIIWFQVTQVSPRAP